MPQFQHIQIPSGTLVTYKDGKIQVPDNPIIGRITGDGIGPDIMKASVRVWDAAVEKAYSGKRKIAWCNLYCGEDANEKYGTYMPQETFDALRYLRVAIKGPLTTPVGGGFRSLNVTLRQVLDLYACVRPVRYIDGVPSPVRQPGKLNVVIFRENTEDVYAGIEYKEGTPEANKVIEFLTKEMGAKIRLDSGIGIKPMSITGSKRIIRSAIQYAIAHKKPVVTLVHKGNIMKFTEGAFRDWGYELATTEMRDLCVTEREWGVLDLARRQPSLSVSEMAEALVSAGWEPYKPGEIEAALNLRKTHGGENLARKVLLNDRIADSIFQQVLLRPDEYSVLATPNLNGDYLSDACAAQVGGLGMAPGANIGDEVALFEATHGTAPKYANKDMVNPGSLILSGVMMLEHLGWNEAAELVVKGLAGAIQKKTVTYDLERQMPGATKVSTSQFGEEIVKNL